MPYSQTPYIVLLNMMVFLVPVGLTLLAVGAAERERALEVAMTGLLALAAAALGYFACGFAFQFGGAAFVSGMPGLQGLLAEWSPLDLALGPGWGLIGLRGFFLVSTAYTADAYFLFLSNLPAVTTAVMVALLMLAKHLRRLQLLAIGLLVSGLIYPLFGNWVWGGGWLANLGMNLGLGHGFIDLAGSGAVFVLGTLVALSVFLILQPLRTRTKGAPRLPPVHFPLFMVLGAMLAAVGWAGLALGNPLLPTQVSAVHLAVNLLLAAAAGSLVVSLYSWFVTGEPDALAAARGTVAGLVGASASCAFIPAWAALTIGALSGLLFLLGLYVCEQKLRLDDPSASLPTFALPGVWGVLALAIFADGRWGAGWNGVGAAEYLGIAGQGVSGLILASPYQPPGTGQLQAQLVGLVALVLVALLVPWLMWRGIIWLRSAAERAQVRQPQPAAKEPEAPHKDA